MDKYQQTAQTWNGLAKIYEEKFMYLDLYNESYELFCKAVGKEDASILEVGSGPGNICHYMLQQQPGWKWLGTDVAPAMVELANKNNPTAVFETRDVRSIGTINRSFNGIVSGFCLPFMSREDAAQFFKDCYQLLEPGGILYLSFMRGPYEDSLYKTGSTGQQTFFHYHPLDKIEEQVQAAGLQVKQVMFVNYQRSEKAGEEHTILIAAKS